MEIIGILFVLLKVSNDILKPQWPHEKETNLTGVFFSLLTTLLNIILKLGPLIAIFGVSEESVGLTKRERDILPHFQPAGINSFTSTLFPFLVRSSDVFPHLEKCKLT